MTGIEIPLALENSLGHLDGSGGDRVRPLRLQSHVIDRPHHPQTRRVILGPAIARTATPDRRHFPVNVP